MLLHQSDLTALSRCAAQYNYAHQGLTRSSNSRSAFGSVMHYALLNVFEPNKNIVGRQAAKKMAIDSFLHYWKPNNIDVICEPVPDDGWLAGDTYMGLRTKGVETITKYVDSMNYDDGQLLATEYSFICPIPDTWDDDLNEPHMLAGSVDYLKVAKVAGNPEIQVVDFKTGKDYVGLRDNMQMTAYALATLQPEFWVGFRGEDGFGQDEGMNLYEMFKHAPRRGIWLSLQKFKAMDAGHRIEKDFRRFSLAVEQHVALIKADIYPLSISGITCQYCEFRNICGGIGLVDEELKK